LHEGDRKIAPHKIVNSALANSGIAGHRGNWTVAAVIAAGGSGTRMNSGIPKQFLKLAGKPILLHAVESILAIEEVIQIVIATPYEHIKTAESILPQPAQAKVLCAPGGSSRQESVRNGIARISRDADIIMVHDAVRPICDLDTMRRVLETARKQGAAVPGIPATDTIQRVSRNGRILATPPRQELYAIQTPQAFHADILRSALDRAHDAGFLGTDESSVVRWAGCPVFVVPGSPDNIKITRPMDLELAEMLISKRSREANGIDMNEFNFHIGQGIDYHRLVEGRKLILGGVEIPYEKGLEGHSDADALLHAVCDALLGAAGLGDIGMHFPDTDPAHRGRSSLEFLREVRAKIEVEGWIVRNVDATLLLQRPKVAPHALLMRQNIAESLGINIERVNIKATTTEGMNAEGRGEGVSAQAVALICKSQAEILGI
jgi:2-C-methyl-D-erythritol 4-phosphate cytidylyltransferase / 2-C-methyl-D-erythritol 2,4-cyclodiphosphate synthase